MLKIILLLLLASTALTAADALQLQEEMANTEELIYLYQEKLRLLAEIYHKNYPNLDQFPRKAVAERRNATFASRLSPHLALLSKFPHPSLFFQNRYFLNDSRMIDSTNSEVVTQFMGEVLILEQSVITTLIGGKISMLEIKQVDGRIKTEEYLLGLNAEKLPSIWHRNYNIKDGEDLLIQWQENRITFRGREVNTITLPEGEEVIAIYSLNQYKVIFVSSQRIGIINSRSLQIGDCENVRNITKIRNSSTQARIRQSYKQDSFIMILLSTGEVAKYINEKIVSIQLLAGLAEDFNLLLHELYLQYVHPYLYVADIQSSSLKIFLNHLSRYQQVADIDLLSSHPNLAFFRQNDSYRMFLSVQNETRIYELLLPSVEEPVSGTNYFKFVGIFIVVACFIYFKWIKKSPGESEDIEQKEVRRKLGQMGRMQKEERADAVKEKPKLTHSQIEQFLKKQAQSSKKKAT